VSAGGPPEAPLVLVVDDSPLVTEALGAVLDATGYRAASAGSVAEAVDAARALRPDLMLLDLTLPDGDGLAVLRALAGDAPPATLALTGHDDPDTAARCLAAGCRAVLVKPVRPAALVAALSAALATR
jgi:CheY-like chemotaxis protein